MEARGELGDELRTARGLRLGCPGASAEEQTFLGRSPGGEIDQPVLRASVGEVLGEGRLAASPRLVSRAKQLGAVAAAKHRLFRGCAVVSTRAQAESGYK
jgi:hypothetical protein